MNFGPVGLEQGRSQSLGHGRLADMPWAGNQKRVRKTMHQSQAHPRHRRLMSDNFS